MRKKSNKIIKSAISLALIFTMITPVNADAKSLSEPIRVGLETKYQQATNVPIKNKSISIGFSNNGDFQPQGVVTAVNGFNASPNYFYYLKAAENLPTYDQAVATANNLKTTYPNVIISLIGQGNWGVYLGGYATEQEAATVSTTNGYTLVKDNGKSVVLSDGATPVILFENISANTEISGANGEYITLGDSAYRGSIEFYRTGSTIMPVNILTVDQYLYSVVPSEMPASWHVEALKAQAVAARNYTMTRAGVHQEQGYELCDNTHCQMYLGAGHEYESSTRAVNETANIMAYYNNEPINATYYSSSGGYTNDSEDVWQNAFPYLRSVEDTLETTHKDWTRTFTMDQLTVMLKEKGYDIGNVQGVTTTLDEKSQRVVELTFVGTNGSKTVVKDEIRTVFNQTEEGSLDSNNFVVQSGAISTLDTNVSVESSNAKTQILVKNAYITDSNGNPTKADNIAVVDGNGVSAKYNGTTTDGANTGSTVTFVGKGWGHGVGMSQYGAKGMAEAGKTYDQILKHYYTGIEVR